MDKTIAELAQDFLKSHPAAVPFGQGCFDSSYNQWPQLKPLLRDYYLFVSGLAMSDQ